jgi:N-methylhydantoinase B
MPADASEAATPAIDMFTMVILRRRFEALITDMVNALFRSGRSGVLNTAMDFTCSVTDAKFQTISTAVGLPVHASAIDLIPRAASDKFGDDMHPGDCFANNSGYHGNTHCGDFTLCSPVFFEGKLVFYTIARAHLADIGFPTPTTYGPRARDVYEEGLIFPCVRIQRDGKDIPEVIDMCRANIRAPQQFYGDYLACLAAVRTGERGIQDICRRYGLDVVQAFLDQYQVYAEDMAVAAIRRLPAGRIEKEARHDSDLPELADGIPVRAILTVDPDAATVEVDLRHNIDNVPLGINLTESTTTASCRNAVLNALGPDVPRCTGAYRRIKILMREGAAVGKPKFPAATSSATTNLAQVLAPLVQSMFADLSPGMGSAFSTVGNPASCSVVSGTDRRTGGQPFANQVMMGYWGGPALHGHDGWLTFGGSGAAGVLWQSSVEVAEQQQPILVERLEIGVDQGGAGQWEGAPGAHCIFRVRDDVVRFTANSAGKDFPPAGAAGGQQGGRNGTWKVSRNGERTVLPSFLDITLTPGEALESLACGGGGYGDPLLRDPSRVAHRVREGWTSMERARDVYGVVLRHDAEQIVVDDDATTQQREKLRAAQVAV